MKNENTFKQKYLNKQRDQSKISETPEFPRILKIDTCNTCNYACIFCPQAKQYHKIGNIDKELCLRIIKEGFDAGARELCVSMTGEPLENPDLECYIEYAKELGYEYVFFNTNGYRMDPERSEKLIKAGIDSIKVSLNSAKKSYRLIHGVDAFDRVKENIIAFDRLRKKENSACKLYISYVAVKQTLEEAQEVKNLLGDYVDEIIVMNANSRGGSISEIQELYAGDDEYSFTYPCSQLFNNVYVTAEGYMIVCCQDFENLTVVADLHEESLADAWNNEKFREFRRKYLSRQLKGTLCQNCIYGTEEEVEPISRQYAYYDISEKKKKMLEERIAAIQKNG